jgi:hypothetical protein
MFRADARVAFDQELAKAEQARQEGYEGRARVCARRAAGIAIRAYQARRGIPAAGRSAYDLLVDLQDLPGISARVRQAAQRLSLRVSEDFTLPSEADLIDEARQLALGLEAHLAEEG